MSNNSPNDSNANENLEWELSELVDAISAEIDEAQNTLSLKSHVRDLSFSIKKLSFDIEIKARRTSDGKFRFRTINPDETSATILRLDFAQVIQSQLTEVRKPISNNLSIASISSIEFLTDINPDEIKALGVIGISSVDDLERYPKNPQILAELSRKTQIKEDRIRMWRQLPFITRVHPDSGNPGSTVIIKGGNFGDLSDSNIQVFFQHKLVKIKEQQETKLIIEIPLEARGSGSIFVRTNNQVTNPIQWTVTKALSKLKIGDYRTIDRIDPLLNAELGPADVISLIFRGLAYIDSKDGVRKPDLARKWEILPSPEKPKHFTVHLQDNIYFHNEDLLTPEDVKFTYEKILELEKSPWHQLAKCTIEDIRVPDDKKIIDFVLKPETNSQALAGLIKLLTIGIVPKEIYQRDPYRFAQKPVGCGPFQFENFIPGQTIELTAFSKYLQGKPKLDQISIRMGMNDDELMQMLDDFQPIIVNFPYSEQLKSKLSNSTRYLLNLEGIPSLLTVESKQIQERSPNRFNSNFNAHLWHLRE